MTTERAELVSKMEEHKAKAEALCVEYNDTVTALASPEENPAESPAEGEESPKLRTLKAIEADLDEVIGEYNATSRKLCYKDCIATGDPMREAVIRLYYPGIKYKDEPIDKDNKDITVRVIVDVSKEINLLDLHERAKGIGHDSLWTQYIKRLNCLLTIRTAKDIGAKVIGHKDGEVDFKKFKDNLNYAAIAKEIAAARKDKSAADPVSNTQLLKTVREMVTAMMGEEIGASAKSHDVNFLNIVYATAGKKALQVVTPAHKTFTWYMAQVCHHLVTGEDYTAFSKEYKEKKQ